MGEGNFSVSQALWRRFSHFVAGRIGFQVGFGGLHRLYISLNSGGKGGVLLAAPPRPPDSADSREEHVKESDRDGRYESTVGHARDSRLRATGSRDGSCHLSSRAWWSSARSEVGG